MFDKFLKNLQGFNSKANWANLATGVALLLLLAGGSLIYFTKSADKSVNESELAKNRESIIKKMDTEESQASDNTDTSVDNRPLGTGGPAINALPNTSSK